LAWGFLFAWKRRKLAFLSGQANKKSVCTKVQLDFCCYAGSPLRDHFSNPFLSANDENSWTIWFRSFF
jgi:hypothetical protein